MILLTGGLGFIGFHMAIKLLDMGHGVIIIDNMNEKDLKNKKIKNIRLDYLINKYSHKKLLIYNLDLKDEDQIKSTLKYYEIKNVIHLSASAGVNDNYLFNNEYIDNNITSIVNLLNYIRKENVNIKSFLFASTSSVYGSHNPPFKEDFVLDRPLNMYAISKIAAENILKLYSKELKNTNFIVMRYSSVYGPYGRQDMIYYKFKELIEKNETIPLYNYGLNIRSFTYIDDIVESTIKLMDSNFENNFDIYNITNFNTYTVAEFLNEMKKYYNEKIKVDLLPERNFDIPVAYMSLEKLKNKIGFFPNIKLEEGLKKLISWEKEND